MLIMEAGVEACVVCVYCLRATPVLVHRLQVAGAGAGGCAEQVRRTRGAESRRRLEPVTRPPVRHSVHALLRRRAPPACASVRDPNRTAALPETEPNFSEKFYRPTKLTPPASFTDTAQSSPRAFCERASLIVHRE